MKKAIIIMFCFGLLMTMGLTCCFILPVESTTPGCFCYDVPSYSDVPVGEIFMWYQQPENLSFGWYVCNLTNHDHINSMIPVLDSMFVVGYNSSDSDYSTIGNTGGAKTVQITNLTMAAHTHVYSYIIATGSVNRLTSSIIGVIRSPTSYNMGLTGGGKDGPADPHNNLPPYRVLYYVIYLGV